MKKRLLRLLLTACLLMGLLPTVALAATATNVSYLAASGKSQTCASATVVESGTTAWSNGWYVVNSNVTIENRVTVSGAVHLILADGCTLTANHGIQVEGSNALTIYGQANGTGKLIATANSSGNAGIGGNGGGKGSGGSCGTIIINGGTVTANGGRGSDVESWDPQIGGGAGIGGGFGATSGGNGGTVTINGGTVTANGGFGTQMGGGAGIGGGSSVAPQSGNGGSGGSVTINGGTVTANGGSGAQCSGGAGIGGGYGYMSGGIGGSVTITGGMVTANGGAGIGGGGYRDQLGGSGGSFQTTNAGNAVIFASSIADKSKQSSWSGVIFDGNEGKVYGTAVTPVEDFTIDSGKTLTIPAGVTLTIPEGVTLTINGTFNNSGKLYVGGTVKENIYYLLTVNGGTFTSSETQTNNGKTYARAGSTITLTSSTPPAGQVFDHWEVSGVSISGNSFTMPSGPVTVTARYAAGLTITTQPTASQTITYGNTATLSVAVSKPSSLTGALTYQWYQGSNAISGATSATYTTPVDLAAGSYTYHCVITCGSNTVTSSNATVTVNPIAEATPYIYIDYENETLTGFASGSSYTIDGTAVTTDGGKLPVAVYLGNTISIVTTARDGNHAGSTAQTITIPARPATPSPAGANESVNGKNDGKITGVDYTMEYRLKDGGSWTACGGTAVTGLAPGTYQVRVKATGSAFASLAADVTIATGSEPTYTLNVTAPTFTAEAYGYAQPAAKAITITSSGSWDSTIAGVTVSGTDFTAGGSGSTVAAGGYINTWTVQPASGLAVGFYTATITVTYNNDATAVAPVSFNVTRAAQGAPAAPTIKSKSWSSVTLEAIPDNEATGAGAQYSKDGATWQDSPVFTGLSANTEYSFAARYGETEYYFASPASAELNVTTGAMPSGGGSSSTTTTEKSPDGTTGTVTTDKDGQVTEASATVPHSAAADAAESGKPVTLPLEVPAAPDAASAPTVTVTVPGFAGEVKVEIPVNNVTSGTVAVVVNADGTEEIIRDSFPTETGLVLTVEGSVTVKIVDNSKSFTDVSAGYWGSSAIGFVAARDLFNGTGDGTTFSPEAPMTRAMLMTVLARFDGVDTAGGGSWYEKGLAWAVENDISDGSNPGAPITREQLAVMLWRYAGCPDSDHSLTGYTDADKISGYALTAMRWANEMGIVNGYGGLLRAGETAGRAEVAQMLMNFVSKQKQ